MFRFANVEWLYVLAVVPLLLLLYFVAVRRRKKALERFGDNALLAELMPDVSLSRRFWKLVLSAIALALVVIGVANPQIGSKYEEVKREGFELMIALDISNSMMAEDLQPNRLERAKQSISKLVDELKGDKIGIVVFAGDAYVQLPLTVDYAAAKLFLSTIDTDIIPTQGTAIGKAIKLSLNSYGEQPAKNRAIIVITDGENHEDDAVQAAKTAKDMGVLVHTIGIGSAQGTPIPLYVNGRKSGFRKDRDGNPVVTKLDEQRLHEIADAGGGIYIKATNAMSALKVLFDELNKMEKSEFGSKMFTDYEDRFQYFIAAGLLLLVIELFLSERKSVWFRDVNIFEVKK